MLSFKIKKWDRRIVLSSQIGQYAIIQILNPSQTFLESCFFFKLLEEKGFCAKYNIIEF